MVALLNDLIVPPKAYAAGTTLISLDFEATGWEASWIKVFIETQDDALTLGADYTVQNAGTANASVQLLQPADGNTFYSVFLAVPPERTSDFPFRGTFKSEPFNAEMDRIWQAIQHHRTLISRCLQPGFATPAPSAPIQGNFGNGRMLVTEGTEGRLVFKDVATVLSDAGVSGTPNENFDYGSLEGGIQIQLRRGNATEHDTFIGAPGEVTYDSSRKVLRVHDGSTAGGRQVGLFHYGTREELIADVAAGVQFKPGVLYFAGGRAYEYRAAPYVGGPSDLAGFAPGFLVTPEHWGADPTGSTECASKYSAAMQWCVANLRKGGSCGTYKCERTVAPGGLISWDFGITRLAFDHINWKTFNRTNLVAALETPTGATSPQPSGLYCLFDLKGCEHSNFTGFLHVRAHFPDDMRFAGRQTIPTDIIGVTSSQGVSPNIKMDQLLVSGATEGLWAGDQRSTLIPAILPFTGWVINHYVAQFCLRGLRGGQAGNTFDDMTINVCRLTMCANFFFLRSDITFNTLFLNGLQYSSTSRPTVETVTMSVDINGNFILSGPITGSTDERAMNPRNLAAGDVVNIFGAALDKEGNPRPGTGPGYGHTTAIATLTTPTTGTLVTPPDQAVTDAEIQIDPPDAIMFGGSCIAAHGFAEESCGAIVVDNNSSLTINEFKISDGKFSSENRSGILLTAQFKGKINIKLAEDGENNPNCRYVVGVAHLQQSTSPFTMQAGRVNVISGLRESEWTKADPIGTVTVEPQRIVSPWTSRVGTAFDNALHLTVEYADGTVTLDPALAGYNPAWKRGPRGIQLPGPNLRSNSNMTGFSVTGGVPAPAGGVIAKEAEDGAGLFVEAVPMAVGDRLRINWNVSSWTISGGDLVITDASNVIQARFHRIQDAGDKVAWITVPAGINPVKIGVELFSPAELSFNLFTVQKVS